MCANEQFAILSTHFYIYVTLHCNYMGARIRDALRASAVQQQMKGVEWKFAIGEHERPAPAVMGTSIPSDM